MNNMNILELLKNGKSVEDLTEDFYDALEQAVLEYDEWQKEEKRKAEALAQKRLEEEYKKVKVEEARQAVGAAILNYFSTLDIEIEEDVIENIDFIVEALPKIKVVRRHWNW